ncbi:MAG: GlsB/YeaQ/YmgE family stress response membrane protein [Deltaproteobacteria bacterium]
MIIGLVVGALAKLVMPGKDPGGIFITMAIGIAGSLIADFVGRAAGWYTPEENAGLIASILGALVLLAAYRVVVHRRVES